MNRLCPPTIQGIVKTSQTLNKRQRSWGGGGTHVSDLQQKYTICLQSTSKTLIFDAKFRAPIFEMFPTALPQL